MNKEFSSIIMLLLVVLIPLQGVAIAQTDNFNSVDDDSDFDNNSNNFDGLTSVDPIQNIGVIEKGHSDITSLMIDDSNNILVDENLHGIFSMVYVDEETMELVVVLNQLLLFSSGIDAGDIEDILGEDFPFTVKYGYVESYSHTTPYPQSYIDRWLVWWTLYDCVAGSSGICHAVYYNLHNVNHYTLDSNNNWHSQSDSSSDEDEATSSSMSVIFQDDFDNGLSQWLQNSHWRSHYPDERRQPSGSPSTNHVLEVDGCPSDCEIRLQNSIDFSDVQNPRIEFDRYIDRSLDRGEYLKLFAYDGSSWNQLAIWNDENDDDDDMWHEEIISLSGYTNDDFNIKFVAKMSRSNEDVAVDNVVITGGVEGDSPSSIDSDNDGVNDSDDDCPEVLGLVSLNGCPDMESPVFDNLPSDMTFERRSATLGKYVTIPVVTATDNIDGLLNVSCDESSGWFAVGTHTVTCTVSDNAGNSMIGSFNIVITEPIPTDRDHDGVPDYSDNCPDEVGVPYNDGCPLPSDSDMDGLDDSGNNCPDLVGAVENLDCPLVLGGQAMDSHLDARISVGGLIGDFESTVTLPVRLMDGRYGIVVSGHSVNIVDTSVSPHNVISNNDADWDHSVRNSAGDFVSISRNDPSFSVYQVGNTMIADFDFIEVDSNYLRLNTILNSNDHYVEVSFGDIDDVSNNGHVTMNGRYSDSVGQLLYRNATVFSDNGITLVDQGITNNQAIRGDSGAPLIYDDSIVGLLHGVACVFESPDENRSRLDLNLRVDFPCGGNDAESLDIYHSDHNYDYYKVFSDWDEVVRMLDITPP